MNTTPPPVKPPFNELSVLFPLLTISGKLAGRQAEVLKLFDAKPEIVRQDVETALGLPESSARRLLAGMEAQGIIAKVGSFKDARYRLVQAKEG